MDCTEFAATLADLLEDEISHPARAAMDAHAAGCAECTTLLGDLAGIRAAAAALPELEPSRDLWPGIADRIPARVLAMEPAQPRRSHAGTAWRHPAVAAAALVMLVAGVSHLWTRSAYEPRGGATAPRATASIATVAVAPPADTASRDTGVEPLRSTEGGGGGPTEGSTAGVARVAVTGTVRGGSSAPTGARGTAPTAPTAPTATLTSQPRSASATVRTEAEPVYDREIMRLRAIVRERRAALDPATVAVLERSIAVIDSANAHSRAALARDAGSGFLASQLNRSLEKKVELLRLTAQLPART